MYHTDDRECISKKDSAFLTGEELLEMDGMLFEAGDELAGKIGEIGEILRKKDSAARRLREAYRAVAAALNERDAVLEDQVKELGEREKREKELECGCEKLRQEYAELQAVNGTLRTRQADMAQRQENSLRQIQELEDVISAKEKNCQLLEEKCSQIRKEYSQYYTDARNDKEKAESAMERLQNELAAERQHAEILQRDLDKELAEKEQRAREMQDLRDQLQTETSKANDLDQKVQQYATQEQRMPIVMKLYQAYNSMMEKREELPEELFERLQNVVPTDHFDSFLPKVLKPSFPISYYLSVQAFMAMYSHNGQMSGEAMREALRVSDDLLSAVFDFGSEYFKEEKLIRLDRKAGDQFDHYMCKYIDGNGGMYGTIVRVWLQGFRDEKNNKIYCSYVEGE